MKAANTFEEFEKLNGIRLDDVLSVFEAVSDAFPLIVSANLTKNTYTMIKDEGFLATNMPATGKFDDLIDHGVLYIHPNYQNAFLANFSRENLTKKLLQGQNEVYVRLYQKGRGDKYQWVSTHVIRIPDKNGDLCEISLNRILSEGSDEGIRCSGAPH